MATAINSFVTAMTNGGQVRTQNMYEMTITTGYSDIDEVLQKMTIYAQGFSAPSRTTNFTDVYFKGMSFPVPSTEQMENEHTITVNSEVAGEVRRACLAWMEKTWNPDIEGGSVLEGDRRAQTGAVVRLHLLSHDMSEVAEVYKLIGVRPAQVGALTMSQSGGDVATFELQLRSLYWTIETGTVKDGAFKDQK